MVHNKNDVAFLSHSFAPRRRSVFSGRDDDSIISQQTTGIRLQGAATSSVESSKSTDTVICGGGPAGLLAAIMMAQKYPEVSVSENGVRGLRWIE